MVTIFSSPSKRSLYKINLISVFIITLTFFCLSSDCRADTNVSGMISTDTTWTLTKSPYIVTGNILVSNGAALTIEPGVTVKVNSGKSL